MQGHTSIIKMRLAGYKPRSVFILDMPIIYARPTHIEDFVHMEVVTGSDPLSSMDMRFVVGLPVRIVSDDVQRGREIAAMCKKASAASVVVAAGDKYAFWPNKQNKWEVF